MVKGFIFNKKKSLHLASPVFSGESWKATTSSWPIPKTRYPRGRDPQIGWLRAKVLTVETAHLLFLGSRSEEKTRPPQNGGPGIRKGMLFFLVGGFNLNQPHLKNMRKSNWESFPQVEVKITLLRVIPTMTCWVKVVRWGLSG